MTDPRVRCPWPTDDPIYCAYHDEVWGVPERDDRALFEKLVLDGFQAGLSWITILRKQDGFLDAFEGFDPERIARYGPEDEARLMADARIVRNRAKISATIGNARAFLALQEAGRSFSDLLWSFTGGEMRVNRPRTMSEVPAQTAESQAMSKALKGEGFRFVGPTICYAFMQATGMVNDHLVECFRWQPVQELPGARRRP